MLESFQILQALDVGVGRGQIGHGLLIAAALGVGFLLRDRIGLAQRLIAVGIDLGQIHRGHDLLARRPGLQQLLIDFRRIDIRQQLALRDVAADVLVPAQQIAVGAGVDRRLDISLQSARQHQFLVRLFGRGMDHGHRGHGVLLSGVGQHVAVVNPHQHGNTPAATSTSTNRANEHQRLARRSGRKLGRRRYLRRSVTVASPVVAIFDRRSAAVSARAVWLRIAPRGSLRPDCAAFHRGRIR